MAERVRITDVSPRDGLQNEPGVIPTAEKVELIRRLAQASPDEVEITSFVSPRWVPQLADAAAVVKGTCDLMAQWAGTVRTPVWSVLVPNVKGLESLEQADSQAVSQYNMDVVVPPVVSKIALFTAASETFSLRNTNATISQSMERFRDLVKTPTATSMRRGYVSCAIACPFEGPTPPTRVAEVAAMLVDVGASEIDLADTIGAGTPETIHRMLDAVRARIGDGWFERRAVTLHLHDTFGRAADCVRKALDMGVRSFDGSVAGLGGCPYASTPGKRAPGNIATELLVRTVHEEGYETGVELDALARAAEFAREIVAKARAGAPA